MQNSFGLHRIKKDPYSKLEIEQTSMQGNNSSKEEIGKGYGEYDKKIAKEVNLDDLVS